MSTSGTAADEHHAASVPCLAIVLCYTTLLAAAWRARRRGWLPREQPVACDGMLRHGLTRDFLIWMLYRGHVEHLCRETTPAGQPGPLSRVQSVRIRDTSFVALTAAGEAFADLFLARAFFPPEAAAADAWSMLQPANLLPSYDPEGRLFRWGAHVLKHFQQPADNQVTVLASAQELGWPRWFDDPLPRGHGNAKVRLHDAIKYLNRGQSVYLVHFLGDGTGTRVGWELR